MVDADALSLDEIGLPLGPGVQVVALRLTTPEAILRAVGHLVPASLSCAVAKRRAEFALGRHAAELALAHFGCSSAVHRQSDSAPLWPPGFVGSISHAAGLAVAAVARASSHRSLGIDVEQIVTDPVAAELSPSVLCDRERDLLATALPQLSRAECFSLGFSAKESLYKCIYPLSGKFFGFEDAELVAIDGAGAHSGTFQIVLKRALPGGFPAGHAASGPYRVRAERVESAVIMPVTQI